MYFGPERKNQRLKNYDYSQEGCYFITFCTTGRIDYFGEIINGNNILNDYGKEFDKIIQETINIRTEIILDKYIIMPNHVHILIFVQKPVGNAGMRSDSTNHSDFTNLEPYACGSYENDSHRNGSYENDILNKTKNSVSNYIQGIKSRFTREIRQNYGDYEFSWQKSFFDVIIQNDEQLYKTREYIVNNPAKWEEDVNNSKNF